MNSKQKYIRHSTQGFILWQDLSSARLTHRSMSDFVNQRHPGRILSAGFVFFSDGIPNCCGFSQSLNKESLPEDSELLAQQLGIE